MKDTGRLVLLAHSGVGIEGGEVEVEAVEAVSATDSAESDAGDGEGGLQRSSGEEDRVRRALRITKPIGRFGGVRIGVRVETTGKTGVEMEALVGVWGAAVNVVDMVKGVDRGVVVEGIRVVGKKGGRGGGWGVWEGERGYGKEKEEGVVGEKRD